MNIQEIIIQLPHSRGSTVKHENKKEGRGRQDNDIKSLNEHKRLEAIMII